MAADVYAVSGNGLLTQHAVAGQTLHHPPAVPGYTIRLVALVLGHVNVAPQAKVPSQTGGAADCRLIV